METVRAQEMQEALSQAHDSLRVRTVYVHDTIYIERPAVEAAQPDSSEIIYTKPVGRFDRGIINYRFIPKKKWVGGLTFSYINYDGEDSRMLFSLIKDFDCNFRTISVRPFVGYAFKDNVIVGLKAGEKEYVADLMLGATTPSFDLEHPIDRTYPFEHITREAVEEVLRSLTGERLQTPPLYSAKKVEGVRAYELARAGEEVELRKALINIYEMELMEYDLPRIRIRVRCSKGTYIRSLAGEIGQALGSGAHLTSLCRTRSGGFRLDAAHELNFFLEKLQKAETK
jgi:tRNA pseudouridine(55) synthase